MAFSLVLVELAFASLIISPQDPPAAARTVEVGAELPVQKPGFDPNHMVCRKFPPPPGTRIGSRRVCKTALEWQLTKDSEQEALERALRKPCTVPDSMGSGPGGCQ